MDELNVIVAFSEQKFKPKGLQKNSAKMNILSYDSLNLMSTLHKFMPNQGNYRKRGM